MIHYLSTGGHDRHTMRRFRQWWAGPLRDRIRILPYERLGSMTSADPGLWIFSDLERLRPRELAEAAALAARLASAGPAFRVLNDPARALGRHDLLVALRDRDVNTHRSWRTTECLASAHFPVFVRAENAHSGAFTDLLRSPEEVEPAIRRLLRWRWRYRRGDLLVVEFLDTSDTEGIFRKYSAMRIGDSLVPRHLLFGRSWVVKKPAMLDAARLREEQEFLDEFAHRDQVFSVFDIAGIDYGRIDYAVVGGRIEVWEINTNPVLIPHPRRVAGSRLDRSLRFQEQTIDALSALESSLPSGPALPLVRTGRASLGRLRTLLSPLLRP